MKKKYCTAFILQKTREGDPQFFIHSNNDNNCCHTITFCYYKENETLEGGAGKCLTTSGLPIKDNNNNSSWLTRSFPSDCSKTEQGKIYKDRRINTFNLITSCDTMSLKKPRLKNSLSVWLCLQSNPSPYLVDSTNFFDTNNWRHHHPDTNLNKAVS